MIARLTATAIARAQAQRRSVASMPQPVQDIDDCTEVYGDGIDPNTLTFEMDDLDVEGEGK